MLLAVLLNVRKLACVPCDVNSLSCVPFYWVSLLFVLGLTSLKPESVLLILDTIVNNPENEIVENFDIIEILNTINKNMMHCIS